MKKETIEAFKETENKIAGLIPKEQMTEEEHFKWIDEVGEDKKGEKL